MIVPGFADLRMHLATDAGQLDWMPSGATPYWAYAWAGGAAIAHHLLASPALVEGRYVLDLGAGSGIAGIAASLCGAAGVTAVDTDPLARTATALNAALNSVQVTVLADDLLDGPPVEGIDLVLAGDVLYERDLAARVVPFLDRCRTAGCEVLLGDPGRGFVPRNRILVVGEYGEDGVDDGPTTSAAVYAFR